MAMVLNVLQYLNERGNEKEFDHGEQDQGLVNNYVTKVNMTRSLLPIHYNWKLYVVLETGAKHF